MNNYEIIFNEILALTRAEQIQWQQIGRREHAEIILNHQEVIRQFSGAYRRAESTFTLLLLERRHLYAEEGIFWEREERRRAELMILEDGELLISLNHYSIKLARMMELLDRVVAQNDRVRRLLGAPV